MIIEVDQEVIDTLKSRGLDWLAGEIILLEHHIAEIEAELVAYRTNCLCGAGSHFEQTELLINAPMEN